MLLYIQTYKDSLTSFFLLTKATACFLEDFLYNAYVVRSTFIVRFVLLDHAVLWLKCKSVWISVRREQKKVSHAEFLGDQSF